MLFLARFREKDGATLSPVLIDDPDYENAVARIVAETGEMPAELRELPAGLLFLEAKFSDRADLDAEEDEVAMWALEPFEEFDEWLCEVDDEEIPPAPVPAPAVCEDCVMAQARLGAAPDARCSLHEDASPDGQ